MKIKALICMLAVLILSIMQVSGVITTNLQLNSVDSVSGSPNQIVDILFEVENIGNDTIEDIQVISSDLVLSGGAETIPAPTIANIIDLEKLSKLQSTFSLTIPSVPAGVYEGELRVIDVNNLFNGDKMDYSVTVTETEAFDLSTNSLKITSQPNNDGQARFTITNTGSSTLIFDLDTEGNFIDDDYDPINIMFSAVDPLVAGDSVEVIVTADIDNSVDEDIYSGKIIVSSGLVEKEINLAVDVQPKICKYGVVGELEISIEEPDNNEEFSPGETMQVEVRVDNDYYRDLDVEVELVLYNIDENEEVVSITSEEEEVNDGDHETFNLELKIPTSDLDEDDVYYLYAKAYKVGDEDEHCIFDRVKIEIERGEDNIIVKKIDLDKEMYSCGDIAYVDVEVENIGTDDQEDIYILLKSNDLQVDLKSERFDLDEYDDIDSRYDVRFEFDVPNLEAGVYYLQAFVNYGNNELESDYVKVMVDGITCSVQDYTEAKIVLTPVEQTITVKPGQEKFVIPLKIENIGGSSASFTLDVKEADGWANIIGIEVPETLNGKESYHAYVYMELLGNVAEGTHNLRVNLRDGDALLQSKMLNINVEEGTLDTGDNAPDIAWLSDIFSNKSKLFWFIGDAILIIIALVFIRMLLRR